MTENSTTTDARSALGRALEETTRRLADVIDDGEYLAATSENYADAIVERLCRTFGEEVTIRVVAETCEVRAADRSAAASYLAPLIVSGARVEQRVRALRRRAEPAE